MTDLAVIDVEPGGLVLRETAPGVTVDEVVLGAADQAGEDNRHVARIAVLLSGLPVGVPAYTVDRLCASGLTAITNAAQAVRLGEVDVVVAAAVESMTRAPWVMAKPGTPWAKPGEVHDTALGWRFVNGKHDGKHTITLRETAERVAALEGITREESDGFGVRRQERAARAIAKGAFDAELVPVTTTQGRQRVLVTADETPRATTMDKLAALKPAFTEDGVVTAGSSSPLSDGASALLVVGEAALQRYALTPRARVVTGATAGVEPHFMGLGPVPATEKALASGPAPWSRRGEAERRRRRDRPGSPAELERRPAGRHAARPPRAEQGGKGLATRRRCQPGSQSARRTGLSARGR